MTSNQPTTDAAEQETFFDVDGNPCSLEALCRKDPLWAASRIRHERAALREIMKGEGAWSNDHLTHASNTIENMKAIARSALGKEENDG